MCSCRYADLTMSPTPIDNVNQRPTPIDNVNNHLSLTVVWGRSIKLTTVTVYRLGGLIIKSTVCMCVYVCSCVCVCVCMCMCVCLLLNCSSGRAEATQGVAGVSLYYVSVRILRFRHDGFSESRILQVIKVHPGVTSILLWKSGLRTRITLLRLFTGIVTRFI